jgi:putative tricarboxylic transport membrane protein
MKQLRRLLPGESAFGWLLLGFSLLLFYSSYRIAGFSSLSSAGGTPLAASGLMVLCAVVVLVRNSRSPRLDVSGWAEAARRFNTEILPLQPLVVYVLIMLGYMWAIEPLGFNLASFLFLFASFWYLHRKGIWLATWLSALNVVIIYVMFQLIFQVTLPVGEWIEPILRSVGR